jgi:hypothetical protein
LGPSYLISKKIHSQLHVWCPIMPKLVISPPNPQTLQITLLYALKYSRIKFSLDFNKLWKPKFYIWACNWIHSWTIKLSFWKPIADKIDPIFQRWNLNLFYKGTHASSKD